MYSTLCGDWAGNAWGECAASTGYASCPDYVANNGGAFADACTSCSVLYATNLTYLDRLGGQLR